MKPFDQYLAKHKIKLNEQLEHLPCPDITVCIPCFDEPKLLDCLRSLQASQGKNFKTLVIVIINAPEQAPECSLKQNEYSQQEAIDFFAKHANETFYGIVMQASLRRKHAGPGTARKIAMDQAIALYTSQLKPKGIIVSLDADTKVKANYLEVIFSEFNEQKLDGASIYFEHPIDERKFSKELCQAISIYELYLRYHIQALRQINYPFAFHTIGSAFAVTANTYVKYGGMNRKNAGEDFYFLHKIIPNCKFADITKTTVYPSPRISSRVVFGTGPTVKRIIEDHFNFTTYAPESYHILDCALKTGEDLFPADMSPSYDDILSQLPQALQEFLTQNSFLQDLKRIQKLAGGKKTVFHKHYLHYWSGFRIVKLLNFLKNNTFPPKPLETACRSVCTHSATISEMLNELRRKQKNDPLPHH